MERPWRSLKGAKFERGDPIYQEWDQSADGMYVSNGAAIAFSQRSTPWQPDPDLFCMALLTQFKGYYPGYSDAVRKHRDCLTFAVLKAHTLNRAGRVTLRSNDPRMRPDINFHYFDEGDDHAREDLGAVITGIRAVRKITAPMRRRGWIGPEEWPGEAVQSDKDLAAHVRAAAWGHHASCSCAIGPEEDGGVLGGDFRVHGVRDLRVVDASVFPRIPGFFIASAVYMIAEKAADVILQQAGSTTPSEDST
jgi:choline dehydrogenase-like flavoprotein